MPKVAGSDIEVVLVNSKQYKVDQEDIERDRSEN
jgi:hypothetical protein